MKIISNKKTLIEEIKYQKKIGFVPTMGAIHKGHLTLIKRSKKTCKKTLVSIFINKPQFNKQKDYNDYPKSLSNDIKILRKNKVDFLYLPIFKEIYPKGHNKNINIHRFKNDLCGKFRPGHFEAVVDVIDRFIKILKPHKIFLGEKDMQQLLLVKEFVKRNKISTSVTGVKTIREKNGLACSSRNFLLSNEETIIGSNIYKLIANKKKNLINKKVTIGEIYKKVLNMGAKKIEYLKIINVNRIVKPYIKKNKYKIFISYYLRSTRLIDNV